MLPFQIESVLQDTADTRQRQCPHRAGRTHSRAVYTAPQTATKQQAKQQQPPQQCASECGGHHRRRQLLRVPDVERQAAAQDAQGDRQSGK